MFDWNPGSGRPPPVSPPPAKEKKEEEETVEPILEEEEEPWIPGKGTPPLPSPTRIRKKRKKKEGDGGGSGGGDEGAPNVNTLDECKARLEVLSSEFRAFRTSSELVLESVRSKLAGSEALVAELLENSDGGALLAEYKSLVTTLTSTVATLQSRNAVLEVVNAECERKLGQADVAKDNLRTKLEGLKAKHSGEVDSLTRSHDLAVARKDEEVDNAKRELDQFRANLQIQEEWKGRLEEALGQAPGPNATAEELLVYAQKAAELGQGELLSVQQKAGEFVYTPGEVKEILTETDEYKEWHAKWVDPGLDLAALEAQKEELITAVTGELEYTEQQAADLRYNAEEAIREQVRWADYEVEKAAHRAESLLDSTQWEQEKESLIATMTNYYRELSEPGAFDYDWSQVPQASRNFIRGLYDTESSWWDQAWDAAAGGLGMEQRYVPNAVYTFDSDGKLIGNSGRLRGFNMPDPELIRVYIEMLKGRGDRESTNPLSDETIEWFYSRWDDTRPGYYSGGLIQEMIGDVAGAPELLGKYGFTALTGADWTGAGGIGPEGRGNFRKYFDKYGFAALVAIILTKGAAATPLLRRRLNIIPKVVKPGPTVPRPGHYKHVGNASKFTTTAVTQWNKVFRRVPTAPPRYAKSVTQGASVGKWKGGYLNVATGGLTLVVGMLVRALTKMRESDVTEVVEDEVYDDTELRALLRKLHEVEEKEEPDVAHVHEVESIETGVLPGGAHVAAGYPDCLVKVLLLFANGYSLESLDPGCRDWMAGILGEVSANITSGSTG